MTLITLGKAEEAENINREKFLQAILTQFFFEHPVLVVPEAITDPQPVIVTVLDNVILTKLVCYHESVPNVYEPYYESRINFDRKGETNTAATIMRSEPMYESDDIVTAVTFRINGLATQDVLTHIHKVFSDKIAASAKNIPELGEGEKWSIKNNIISIRKDTKNSNYIVRTRTKNKLAVQMALIMFQGSDTKLTIGSDSIAFKVLTQTETSNVLALSSRDRNDRVNANQYLKSVSALAATNQTAPRQKPQRTGERLHVAGVTAPYKPKPKPTYVKAKTQPKTTTELSARGNDILRKTRNSFKRNTGDHIIERVKRANNKTINEAKQMQVRIRKGKQGKYALTHINYDITHGHLQVWTQSANTADANSDSRDDKARKAKEDT